MSFDRPDADYQLDVREIDGEPFGDIVAALDELAAGESLLLINSFEPQPLYQVIAKKGLSYETSNPESDVWYVRISST